MAHRHALCVVMNGFLYAIYADSSTLQSISNTASGGIIGSKDSSTGINVTYDEQATHKLVKDSFGRRKTLMSLRPT